jgi:hypothetical protein
VPRWAHFIGPKDKRACGAFVRVAAIVASFAALHKKNYEAAKQEARNCA